MTPGIIDQRGWEPPPVIVYSISFDPTSYVFTTSGGTEAVTTVTCTANGSPDTFTCSIYSDTDNIIEELVTTSGNSSDSIWLTCITNSTQHEECAEAILAVTCGDTTEYFSVYQDGTVLSCS